MDVAGKRVTVMGLGRFGGGVGVTRFLVSRGATVTVTDTEPPEKLTDSLRRLADLPAERVRYALGGHHDRDFAEADLIVVNPAVDVRGNRFLATAELCDVPLTSEIRLLVAHLPEAVRRRRTIGVTGTAGKSTTTMMIGHALAGLLGPERVHVGGNIGGSLLPTVDRIADDHAVVLELSSFMLEGLALDGWSPHVAVVTNVTPNHLDRHGTLERYALAKQVVLEHQRPGDFAVLGSPLPTQWIKPRTTNVLWLESLSNMTGHPEPALLIPGAHNVVNAQLAVEACGALGLDRRAAAVALQDFAGLPHRLQFIAEAGGAGGVRYYNDSKATTPEAAVLAMTSFPPRSLHVILGGYDKGSDLSEMSHVAAAHAAAVYTVGTTGDVIAQQVESLAAGGAETAVVHRCGDLDTAMRRVVAEARRGQTVLLSPGCASWGQFDNYEKRGAAFAELVLRYTGEGAPAARP